MTSCRCQHDAKLSGVALRTRQSREQTPQKTVYRPCKVPLRFKTPQCLLEHNLPATPSALRVWAHATSGVRDQLQVPAAEHPAISSATRSADCLDTGNMQFGCRPRAHAGMFSLGFVRTLYLDNKLKGAVRVASSDSWGPRERTHANSESQHPLRSGHTSFPSD